MNIFRKFIQKERLVFFEICLHHIPLEMNLPFRLLVVVIIGVFLCQVLATRKQEAIVHLQSLLEGGHDGLMAESIEKALKMISEPVDEEWFFDRVATEKVLEEYYNSEWVKQFILISDHDFEDPHHLYTFGEIMIPHRMIALCREDLPGLCRILVQYLTVKVKEFMLSYRQSYSASNVKRSLAK